MRDDRLNMTYITDCISQIQTYTRDGKSTFVQTRMIQDAVIRNFEVLGEATKNLSDNLKLAYPDVPWRKMAGFRDVLIHNYINVDLELVWEIIQVDLADLKPKIEAIVQTLGETTL